MKHTVLIAGGVLHIIPPTCIAVLASNPSELTVAITVCILFFGTLGLGYLHGHERTWSAPQRLSE